MGRLLVHRVSFDTNYQGFFLAPQQDMGERFLSFVDGAYNEIPGEATTFLYWWQDTDSVGGTPNGKRAVPTELFEVWGAPRKGQNLAEHGVWPRSGERVNGVDVGAFALGNGDAVWSPSTLVNGIVRRGTPPKGRFVVPGGTGAGAGYISPSYAASSDLGDLPSE